MSQTKKTGSAPVKSVDPIEEKRLSEIRKLMEGTMQLEWLPPHTITPNDRNWKHHTLPQRKALRAFMQELEAQRSEPASAWVGALLYNKRTGRLLDGHMRLIEAIERSDDLVPTLVIDVDENTENLILRFLDQIGTMFNPDEKMVSLLDEVINVENQILFDLLAGSAEPETENQEAPSEPDRKKLPPGGLALSLGAKYDYIVLLFKTELDWNAAKDHFGLAQQMCPFSNTVGIGRVIDGGAYMYRIRHVLSAGVNELDESLIDKMDGVDPE